MGSWKGLYGGLFTGFNSKAYHRQYYLDNIEYFKKQSRDHYLKNKKSICSRQKKYYKENKEKVSEQGKKHYKENKNKIDQRNKEWQANNKDKIKKIQKRYKMGHKKEIKAYNKDYHKNNISYKRYKKDWRRKNSKKEKLRQNYKMSLEDFNSLILSQENKCGICGSVFNQPCIDHDHMTGKIRGLLCRKCNGGLGGLKDNSVLLIRALKWLQELKPELIDRPGIYVNKIRENSLRRNFSLSTAQYNAMILNQNNQCGICEMDFIDKKYHRPCVDHCHVTGKIRGLLCRKCNTSLGLFKDDVENIKNAIKWLQQKG